MLLKSHSFIVRKANGIDDYRIQLRAAFWDIKSERKIRQIVLKIIDNYRTDKNQPGYADALLKHYNAQAVNDNGVMGVLRILGILQQSERLTYNQK